MCRVDVSFAWKVFAVNIPLEISCYKCHTHGQFFAIKVPLDDVLKVPYTWITFALSFYYVES